MITIKGLIIAVIIIAIMINFNNYIFGGVDFVNLFATVIYLVIWFVMYIFALRNKNRSFVLFTTVYWCIACATYILFLLARFDIIDGYGVAITLGLIFVVPMSGINLLFSNVSIVPVYIIIGISLLFIVSGTIYLIRMKKKGLKF